MNNQINRMDFIDRYLEKSLSPEEEKIFEQELQDDPELMRELTSQKVLVDAIKLHGRKDLRRKMSEWDNQLDDTFEKHGEPENRFSFRWYYAAAAILILLVSVFVIVQYIDDDQGDIVARHYEPYVFIPGQTRGVEEVVESAQMFHDYENGRYLKVIEYINQSDASGRSNLVQFLLANSYQALDKFEEAIPIFENIIRTNSDYVLGAKWYLSLCYLSTGKTAEAKNILQELTQSPSSFARKAEGLLSEIE